jgi:DNA-binding CsgD family transcriptional regulator
MKLKALLFLLFILHFNFAQADYVIKGNVNLGMMWKPKIYMAAIDKLDDYYKTSADLIIKTADIDENGNFILSGSNLPNEKRFYRLYLIKEVNSEFDACHYFEGEDHNFVHVILDNNSNIEIEPFLNTLAPFGEYNITGNKENQLMRTLADIVFPSFYFYKIKFPNEREFEEVEFQRNLKHFADTCSNPLVALAAVNNTDIEHFFDDNKTFYFDFLNRLKNELPKSAYTQNFEKKLNYLAGYQPSDNSGFKILSLCLLLALFGAAYYIWTLRAKLAVLKNQSVKPSIPAKVTPALTKKEEEILEFIKAGKSNKEIASELFIELSTVKTHINKIYSKLGISNRNQAKKYLEEKI